MAIKVLEVGGEVLSEDNGCHNQDFLMINQPMFAFANTEDYLRLTKILVRDHDVPTCFFAPLRAGDLTLPEQQRVAILAYMRAEGITDAAIKRMKESLAIIETKIKLMPVANPLGVQYFSAAPFLFGPARVMKFSAKPCVVVPTTEIPVPPGYDYLRHVLTQTMQRHDNLQFDFMVQVRPGDADPSVREEMGIENASSLWDEATHPFMPIAKISIHLPQPEVDTDAHRERCEKLVFTPWHCLAAHQPIGSINRLRKAVYEASSQRRLGCPVGRDAATPPA